jgi:hypothetical protein
MRYVIHILTLATAATICAAPIASIIKVSPKEIAKNPPAVIVPYKDLVCSDTDRMLLAQLITTMATNNKFSLLIKKSDLEALDIYHLHPLKFLTGILTNPSLKILMSEIFDDKFKRDGFLGGLAPGLTRDANEGKLMQYANDFAAEMQADPDKIKEFFRTQKWEAMVRYLIES